MFKKAERKQIKLKIAITGPSGSGKTYSALELASGIGKKIALIDTENGSASLYADRFEFDTMTITEPYTIAKYTTAMKAAISAGYEVLIVDSLTHAWAGQGGLLEKKAIKDAAGGNSYTNWNGLTQEQEKFVATILNSNIHMISTIRSKQDYIMQENSKGKQAPVKVGLAPIQREGMEYEFTTVFDVDMTHHAQASKDRTGLWADQVVKISKETGQQFMKWINSGAVEKIEEKKLPPTNTQPKPALSAVPKTEEPQQSPPPEEKKPEVSREQVVRLFAIANEHKWKKEEIQDFMTLAFHISSTKDLDALKYNVLCRTIQSATFEKACEDLMGTNGSNAN